VEVAIELSMDLFSLSFAVFFGLTALTDPMALRSLILSCLLAPGEILSFLKWLHEINRNYHDFAKNG